MKSAKKRSLRILGYAIVIICITILSPHREPAHAADAFVPTPLLETGKPVDWWFVFKFNTASFPSCANGAVRACIFGDDQPQNYKNGFSQQFAFASSDHRSMKKGNTCIGDTLQDPVGATFDQVYHGSYYYVIWNDQFYNDPDLAACNGQPFCDKPWAHSKGMLAWNDAGEGFVLQVTTPSWPAAGSKNFPRENDGNTLGCVSDNNVKVSQHFFSLKLTKDDVVKVLKALQNASVVTDHSVHQIVNNGGPADIRELVEGLGKKSVSKTVTKDTLSSGVQLISKPSRLQVPPWQMVSAVLGGVSLRTATWWSRNKIPTTDGETTITCWDDALGPAGPVEIAISGEWHGTKFGLRGGNSKDGNHAKVGVTTDGNLSIFGDMNQEGALSGPDCTLSQNPRGGLFYVVDDEVLAAEVKSLIGGDTAP
jgi:hypothetical protein